MLDIEKMYNATPSHAAAEAGDNKEFPRGSRKHSKCYYPVYYVSWFDAILFCNEKSKRNGFDTIEEAQRMGVQYNHFECEFILLSSEYPMNAITLFFSFLFITNLCAAQRDNGVFREYSLKPSEEITATLRNDLASKDASRRDKAVLFLSILINSGTTSQKDHETICKLAGDKEIVNSASDLIEERLAGWYEERESAQERSLPMYYPLIHLLSISNSKVAANTLSLALPAVGFDPFFRKSVYSSERVLKTVLSKLAPIESRLCCFFPGRDLVCEMQAIDFRLTMLSMYKEAAKDKGPGFRSDDAEMKKLVSGCLEFGDENKGRIIRTKAVEIACICIKAGQKEFLPAIKKIAESDPCYLYKTGLAESNSLPQYDIPSKYYPVREKAKKELVQLNK
jgi:hypothetical protein